MEDHYLRVHTLLGSALVLMRLRDAVALVGDLEGMQVHRSWWVARAAIADGAGLTRSREIPLTNGLSAPVARDSVDRLRQSGFLPD